MIYKYDNWDPRTGEYSGTVNFVNLKYLFVWVFHRQHSDGIDHLFDSCYRY